MEKDMEKADHSGHRKRMRRKFIDYGADAFEQHEILEMLLYYVYPRKDTNPIAHNLIDHFGSLANVFDAPFNALLDAGLSENTAVFIKLMPELFSRYAYDRFCTVKQKQNFEGIREFLITKFLTKSSEEVYLVLLSAKKIILFSGFIDHGGNSSAEINISKICDYALRYKAKYAVIAHNHPSGVLVPSQNDIKSTAKLYESLNLLEIELLNHYIVAENSALGMKEIGALFKSVSEYEKSGMYSS